MCASSSWRSHSSKSTKTHKSHRTLLVHAELGMAQFFLCFSLKLTSFPDLLLLESVSSCASAAAFPSILQNVVCFRCCSPTTLYVRWLLARSPLLGNSIFMGSCSVHLFRQYFRVIYFFFYGLDSVREDPRSLFHRNLWLLRDVFSFHSPWHLALVRCSEIHQNVLPNHVSLHLFNHWFSLRFLDVCCHLG